MKKEEIDGTRWMLSIAHAGTIYGVIVNGVIAMALKGAPEDKVIAIEAIKNELWNVFRRCLETE